MRRIMLGLTSAIALAATGALAPAHATFIINPNCINVGGLCPGEVKFFNGSANHGVSTFTGTVGGEHSGPAVTVTTIGKVNTGAGFSTIKPIKGGTLTDLIFTPADDTLFNDFSFRGQLEATGFTGIVDVNVTDQSGVVSNLVFTGLRGPNADFLRQGIIAVTGSGETIKSVELKTPGSESFKEVKQLEFSFAAVHPIPEPASMAVLGTGVIGLFVAFRRRKT